MKKFAKFLLKNSLFPDWNPSDEAIKEAERLTELSNASEIMKIKEKKFPKMMVKGKLKSDYSKIKEWDKHLQDRQ